MHGNAFFHFLFNANFLSASQSRRSACGKRSGLWARLLAGTATATLGAVAAQAETAHIPLSYVIDGNQDLRLSIMVGIGGGAPKPYLFDTGSSNFNLAYTEGLTTWVPTPTSTIGTNVLFLYGVGSIGYLVDQVTYPTLTFYSSTGGHAYTLTSSGAPFQVGVGEFVTTEPSQGTGAPIVIDGHTYYEQLSWANALQAGTPPEYSAFYGTFGAGAFVSSTNVAGLQSGSVLGQATRSGYVVSANGPATPSAQLPCSPCVTLGLTPELRAQFTTQIAWSQNGPSFPVSGANGGIEHGTPLTYTLSAPGLTSVTWTANSLIDSGTPFIAINPSVDISAYLQGSSVVAGTTLTVTDSITGAQAQVVVTDGFVHPITNWIVDSGTSTIGISFFLANSVLYDLENRVVGYTSSFVTDIPITTPFDVGPELGHIGMAGVVSGHDGVKVTSGGYLTLSARNTYTGKTAVSLGGSLILAGPGSIAQSSEVMINGTFDISRVTSGTEIKTLSGDGNVFLGAQALTIAAGSTTFSGSLLDGGQVNATGGSVVIAGGLQTFSGTSTYTGGTTIFDGAGLKLTGSVQGPVTNDGLFINNGTVAGAVTDTGLLMGNGTINGALTVASGGQVAPGNSIGTLHVNGSVAFAGGSTYAAELGASGSSDLIAVDGTVTITGGALALIPGAGFSPTLGAQYQVLTATGGITGAFTLDPTYFGTAGSVLPFLGAALDMQGDTLDLTIVRSAVPFSALAQTPNAFSVATAAAGIGTDTPLGTALVGLPGAQAQSAFNALSGEAYASVDTVLQQQSVYVREAVGARLRQSVTAPGVQALAYANGAGPKTAELAPGLTPTLWGQGYGGWGNSFGNGNAASISNSLGGFLIGADVALGTNARAGMFGGFSQSQFDVDARSSSGSIDNYDLGAYVGAQFGGLALRGGASYTWHDVSMNRSVLFPGFTASTDGGYTTGTTQVFGEAGYDVALGAFAFEPFAGLAYVNVSGATLTEGGGSAAGLSVNLGSMDTLYSTLGVRAATSIQLYGRALTPSVTLGWQHAFGDTTPAATMLFAGGATPFQVSGVPIAEDALLLGAGLSYAFSDIATLGVTYTGQLASSASQNAFTAQFSLKF